MKTVFTYHILYEKLPQLRKRGFIISLERILDIISNPDHVDGVSDNPKYIVSKSFERNLILRVVYKVESDIITVITIYPTTKGRYY